VPADASADSGLKASLASAVAAAAAKVVGQRSSILTHSRGSSGASVKFVSSSEEEDTPSSNNGGTNCRTLSEVSSDNDDDEDLCRVVILTENEEEMSYGALDQNRARLASSEAVSEAEGDGKADTSGQQDEKPLLDQQANSGLERVENVGDSDSDDAEVGGANSAGYTRHRSRGRHRQQQQQQQQQDVRIEVQEEDEADNGQVEEEEIPMEIGKFLFAFVFLFLGAVATTTSLALTHERVPEDQPLPDVVLDNVPYQSWGLDASEFIIMGASMATFTLAALHGHRTHVLRRIFFLGGLHYFYRAVTMYVTVLPKPDTTYVCVPKADHVTFMLIATRVAKLLSGFGLSINGEHVYCGDYIYSGHTMTLVMTYLIVSEYSPKSWWILHWFSWLTTAAGIVVLMLARGHYSIDVVVAYWITTRLWWVYHTLANNPPLAAREDENNYLDRFWWWPIFRWLEGNVGRPLPKVYSLPLPEKVKAPMREYLVEAWTSNRRRRRRNRTPAEA